MTRRLLALVACLVAVTAICAGVADAHPRSRRTSSSPAGRPWTLGGKPCNLIAVPAATPLGVAQSCPGVRPGAAVVTPTGVCAFNFLWRGSDGARYMGTAGHCILDQDGERAWARGQGPVALDGTNRRVGEFAYAVVRGDKDFALVRLDPGVQASPQMCHFGGPTGINTDRPGLLTPTVLQQFGHGLVVGTATPARTHVALGMPDPDHVFAIGVVLPGDSGSPVTSADGRAVGVVVTVGLHTGAIGTNGLDAGTVGISRIAPLIARASQVTGVTYTLHTAPIL